MDQVLLMARCLQLARLGEGYTLTNPMVGALLFHDGRIIGEGYHSAFGADHGEIEAIKSVEEKDQQLIAASTLYVNLEPCCYHGKTPPCADEIIRRRIKRVVIGTSDPNPKVNGLGIERLKSHGVEVSVPMLEAECKELNRSFFTNMQKQRPFILLKYACSRDSYIGNYNYAVPISNAWSRYIVHKVRHEVDGILIGTRTALNDNPRLSNRFYYGKSPVRIILDRLGKIPADLHLFSDGQPTWLFTENTDYHPSQVKIFRWENDLHNMMRVLLNAGIGSLLVEGGAHTLQSFIDLGLWDEIWVTQSDMILGSGVKAPFFTGNKVNEFFLRKDTLSIYKPL